MARFAILAQFGTLRLGPEPIRELKEWLCGRILSVTCGLSCFLHIQAEFDLVGQHLQVALRLHPAAHDAECFPRFAVSFHERAGVQGSG
jgi:hypothetical protein